MATHSVTMKQPNEKVINTDVEFIIREGDRKLGELHVSKGSIEWLPSNGRYKRRMRWSKFATIMEEKGKILKSR